LELHGAPLPTANGDPRQHLDVPESTAGPVTGQRCFPAEWPTARGAVRGAGLCAGAAWGAGAGRESAGRG
jgi:hypothetical protein